MKVCGHCGRSYVDEAVVCTYDGQPLSGDKDREAGPAPPPSWDPPDDLQPGDLLGQYRITAELARGGMGVVYSARHVHLDRQVALKVLRPSLVHHPQVVQRFFAEARAVNEIRHPNIIDVFDLAELQGSNGARLVYMVMELLSGEELRQRIGVGGPLPPRLAAAIADQIAAAVAATHRVHILHRDLKPENVFLVQTPGVAQPMVKLLDFGVATAFGERQREKMTDPGSPVGTPAYMAPEQILERDLDERTDIYALGVVMYEMLTGSPPFSARGCAELMIKHVQERPVPLRLRRACDPPVPPALEKVVMTCLEKEPAQRFQSMTELRDALANAIRPRRAGAFDADRTLPPLTGRRPLYFLGAALIVAAAALAVLLFVASRLHTSPAHVNVAAPLRGFLRTTALLEWPRGEPAQANAAAPAARPPATDASQQLARPVPAKRPRKAARFGSRESTVDPFTLGDRSSGSPRN